MRFFALISLWTYCAFIYALEFVSIDGISNPNNSHGSGSVDYAYNIGTYEITNQQYCDFLNCVASHDDPYALFSSLMFQHFLGGINRTTLNDGTYAYFCKPGYENRPVISVTWMSAVRFINWLHYNSHNIEQSLPIEQWNKCTEGDDKHGAYDTRSIPDHRNKNAAYWLPNRSEWEKAAYFNKTTNSWNENHVDKYANYYNSDSGWAIPYPHIAEVGLSCGSNGTYDQQGNAAEWVEDSNREGWKLALGGSLIRPSQYTLCGITEGDDPNKPISTFGFRVCQSPDTSIRKQVHEPYFPASGTSLGTKGTCRTDCQGGKYVLISDIGNKGDCINQYRGAVYYQFYLSRTELSNAQYCIFLNSVATKSDPFHLYSENMGNSVCGGIIRHEINGSYHYECIEGWAKRPVVYISFYSLARYANWMHFGCPNTGQSEFGTTEGDDKQGAYDTRDFEDVRNGAKKVYENFGKRNTGAKFWIPNEDEWYKAAYYDPTIIGHRKYHDYPTGSDTPPSKEQANYVINNELSVGPPYFVAEVDDFSNAPSYYGTLQQGGNVWEWIESWQYGNVGCRGLKGGSWSYTAFGLNAINTDPGGIDDISYVFGGRLCMAHDENGYHPIGLPVSQQIYQWVMLLSPNRIFAFIATTAFIILILIVVIIANYVTKRNKAQNKRMA